MEKMERKGAAGVKVGKEESRYSWIHLGGLEKWVPHLGKRRRESLSGIQVAGQTFAKRESLSGFAYLDWWGEGSREDHHHPRSFKF